MNKENRKKKVFQCKEFIYDDKVSIHNWNTFFFFIILLDLFP